MHSRDLAAAIAATATRWREPGYEPRETAIAKTLEAPNRFTAEAVVFAVNQQMSQLDADALIAWSGQEELGSHVVCVVSPGNVPLADLQDFLAVVLTGNVFRGKVSTKSPHLLPAFVDDLCQDATIDAAFCSYPQVLREADALIVTGDDESVSAVRQSAVKAGIPPPRQLIRGHSFSTALTGANESDETLERLAEDILLHEGRGCRNVAVVWAPRGASPDPLLEAMARFRSVFPAHAETAGSLKMQIALQAALEQPYACADDDSFLVTPGDPEPQSPGHLRWSEYDSFDTVRQWLKSAADRLQIVVVTPTTKSLLGDIHVETVAAGEAQRPPLGWVQGSTDVIRFLRDL